MRNIAILAIIAAATFSGCSNKADPSEENFRAALSQYFDKKGDLCLDYARSWPVDVRPGAYDHKKLSALEAVGLVKGEDVEVSDGFWKQKIRRYVLTDASKPFARETEAKDYHHEKGWITVKQTDLCWGKKSLDKIVKWEGPIKFGDYQEVKVFYTYKINNAAPWATNPDIQSAFPHVKATMDGEKKDNSKHGLKLTSLGWEANGME